MHAILISAFNALLGFVLTSAIGKFFFFFALFFVTTEFVEVLIPLLPTAGPLSAALGGIPPDVWYWLDLFQFGPGLSAIVSAWVLRFTIRRIPIIG